MRKELGVEVEHVRQRWIPFLSDKRIFDLARAPNTVVISKDRDLAEFVLAFGPPPQVIWVTCGNTSTDEMKRILTESWPRIKKLLAAGEPLIELR
jgi:predicted nuclease of predicted toxin-antitoxin system